MMSRCIAFYVYGMRAFNPPLPRSLIFVLLLSPDSFTLLSLFVFLFLPLYLLFWLVFFVFLSLCVSANEMFQLLFQSLLVHATYSSTGSKYLKIWAKNDK